LHTTNGGNSWQIQKIIKDKTEIDNDLRSVFAIDKNNVIAVGLYWIIINTSNGGKNWIEQKLGIGVNLLCINFSKNSLWLVGDYGTILKILVEEKKLKLKNKYMFFIKNFEF